MLREDAHIADGHVELQLFGWWNLQVHGSPVTLGHREQRLVALLAIRGSRPRSQVAGTLWPDTTEERALTSLRAAVLHTRRQVCGLLDVGRTTLGLQQGVHVDVQELHRCAADIGLAKTGPAAGAMATLASADLLPGWYEDWVLLERERLQHLRLHALESLALTELDRGNPALAATAARAATLIEPLRESAHAIVIRAHLLAGNRSAAVREFHYYRQRLEKELAIAPSPELTELVRPLFNGGGPMPPLDGAHL